MDTIEEILEQILTIYSQPPHFDTLLEAKDKYFELTGIINEDDEEFESRMNCFNDWYIFHFLSKRSYTTVVKHFLEQNQITDNISESLLNINHSLFEFVKVNRKNNIVIKDLVKKEKIEITNNLSEVTLMDNDIFTGRTILFSGYVYLLKGLCFFPYETRSILIKQAKIVHKKNNNEIKSNFLLNLENLKTKYIRYGHLDSKKIFKFE
jgi:hypothetical protein